MRTRAIRGVAAALTIVALVACGGGGGGSTIPAPKQTPADPSPRPTATATPSPRPSTSPSTGPSASPTTSPSGSPSPTISPSPTATPTLAPTPLPSPTPTPLPSLTPSPTPNPSPTATANATKGDDAGNGSVNGTDDQIVSSAPNTHNNTGEGNLEPGDPGATAQGGGQGQDVDGIPCATSMPSNYHVHAFVGLYVNGQAIAIPDAIGMVDPNVESPSTNPATDGYSGITVYAQCFYYLHTHDASGMIHMEAPSPTCGAAANYVPLCTMSLYTLGTLLDIWGVSISPSNFGPFNGMVSIYTGPLNSTQQCTYGSKSCETPSNTYTLYTGDPTQIPLYSHTIVWILVGTGNPTGASLPNVVWFANP